MQAITIAIGKAGILFFAQELVAKELVNPLSALKPPDRAIPVSDFTWNQGDSKATNIGIYLTQGKLLNFSTKFQSISQQGDGVFPLMMTANNFSAQYAWEEKYNEYQWDAGPRGGHPFWSSLGPSDNIYSYSPTFSGLNVTIPLQFKYNNEWEVVVLAPTAKATHTQANIPSNSIIQYEEGCFSHHVSEASAAMVSAIDFSAPVSRLIKGIVAGIPDSGNLGNGIVYDFSLGDSGLQFPHNDGIQMGVKGGASYKGTPFSDGDKPPSLPLPVPPSDSDTHHLNMYVSNYEVDALNWAYFKAKKLNLLITPQDLDDPQLLDVSTYTSFEPALEPYSAFVMNAQITQNKAPVTSFQTAYIYTKAVMTLLKSQLPTNIYKVIQALPSNAYLSQADVDAFLTKATVPNQYFATIENAGKVAAMVLTQDISYTLLIQNNDNPPPNIEFSTKRIDVLTNLGLGISSNNAQTLQFGFANARNSTTYGGSTIPGFDGGVIFEAIVWAIAEGLYAKNLADLGKTGVPLPIMQNFQFDFENAQLSIQNGYVSILASVLYKS